MGHSQGTKCKATQCWTFRSLQDLNRPTSALDLEMSIPSFNISEQMLDAHLLQPGTVSVEASGRDDRPGRPNNVTIVFKLRHTLQQRQQQQQDQAVHGAGAWLRVQAPSGFLFGQDCRSGEGVYHQRVDAAGVLELSLPSDSANPWELAVPALSCQGNGPSAVLRLAGALESWSAYKFFVYVEANPASAPIVNQWILEAPHETSAPFPGFLLRTFSNVSVRSTTTAALTDLLSPKKAFVDVSFRPRTAIGRDLPVAGTGAALVLTAPAGFRLLLTSPCPLLLSQQGGSALGDFGSWEATCEWLSDESLAIQLVSDRVIVAGYQSLLTVGAYNPPVATPAGAPRPQWTLASFQDSQLQAPADEATVPGYAVSHAVGNWSYEWQGELMGMGGAVVHGLQLSLRFVEGLSSLDEVIIQAPEGYDLEVASTAEGHCSGFSWGTSPASPLTDPSRADCSGRELRILVHEDSPIPNGTMMHIILDVINPLLPPKVDQRQWHVRHFQNETLLSAGVFDSWPILPSFQDVAVSLTGPNIEAGSTSELEFSFLPAGEADRLRIDALQPAGFNFSMSYSRAEDQVVIAAADAMVHVSISMSAGQVVQGNKAHTPRSA